MNIESIKAKLIELGALHPTGNVCETLEHCEFYALFLMGEDYKSVMEMINAARDEIAE